MQFRRLMIRVFLICQFLVPLIALDQIVNLTAKPRFLWNQQRPWFFPLNWIKLPPPVTLPPKCDTLQLCCKNQCTTAGTVCSTLPAPASNMFCQTTASPPAASPSTVCKNVPATCPACDKFPCTGNPVPCKSPDSTIGPICPTTS